MDQEKTGLHTLSIIHGLYYCGAGLWPIIHMRSFLFITGPKVDLWLVETVGMLVFSIGLGLLIAGGTKDVSFPISLIAISSAIGFILVDAINVWTNSISPIYLLDALVEFILLTGWLFYIFKTKLWRTV